MINLDDDENIMLSGDVMDIIEEKSNMLETLKKIELMNISNDEKDMLFIITQNVWENDKETIIKSLESIIKFGSIYPDISNSKIIQDKIDAINNKEREDAINIAINLKKKLENSEIAL